MNANTKILIDTIICEFEKNSGIKVNQNSREFVAYYGPQAIFTAGMYESPTPGVSEKLFFVPKNYPDRELETLLHEIGHASGIRVNRPMIYLNTFQVALEECIAETIAGMLLERFGMLTEESKSYISNYIEKYTPYLLTSEIATIFPLAKEAVDFILSEWLPNCSKRKQAA